MKKAFVLVLSVMLICTLFSCNIGETPQPTNQITGEATNGNDDPGKKISVILPEGWAKVEGSVLEHQYMKNTASLMIKEEPFEEKTLDGIVEEAAGIFKNTFTGFEKTGENEYIKIGGVDAIKTSFTCKVGSFQMKYIYVYLILNNEVNAITFGDLADTFDDLNSDYTYILEHMTFVD